MDANVDKSKTTSSKGYAIKRSKVTRNPSWRTEDPQVTLHKTLLEMVYGGVDHGNRILIQGVDFSNYWHDSGQQWYAINLKLSTSQYPELEYVTMRHITISHCVFRSIAQAILFAWNAASNNPDMDDIIIEHCAFIDVDTDDYGTPGNGGIMGLQAAVQNLKIRNCLFDITQMTTFWYTEHGGSFVNPGEVTGLEMKNNIFMFPGDHVSEFSSSASNAPITSYFGETVVARGFFDYYCVDPIFQKNIVVSRTSGSNELYHQWGNTNKVEDGGYYTTPLDFTTDNWIYLDSSGRTTVEGIFNDATNGTVTNRDYRIRDSLVSTYVGTDGRTIGPDWYAMFKSMGPAWPFPWRPNYPGKVKMKIRM